MGNPSGKSNQGCAEIAFHPVGKHGGDNLVRANFLKHFLRGKDVGAGRRADQKSLHAGQTPRSVDGILVGHLHDVRDAVHIQHLRDKSVADPLNLMKPRLLSQKYGNILGFSGTDSAFGVLLQNVFCNSLEGSAAPDAGHEHVDPSKEATAQEKRLKNHTTTLASEYAKQGKDWESELRQCAKEKELMDELGLTVEVAAPSEQGKEDDED